MTLSTNITDTTNEATTKRRVISLSERTYNRLNSDAGPKVQMTLLIEF